MSKQTDEWRATYQDIYDTPYRDGHIHRALSCALEEACNRVDELEAKLAEAEVKANDWRNTAMAWGCPDLDD